MIELEENCKIDMIKSPIPCRRVVLREVHDQVVRNQTHRQGAVRGPVDLIRLGQQRSLLIAEKYLVGDDKVHICCSHKENETIEIEHDRGGTTNR